MASQFTVKLGARPDALAELLESLAAHGTELREISVSGIGRQSAAVLMTNDEHATRTVLRAAGFSFVEGEVLITSVPDEPGALASLVRYLADAEVRLQGLLLLRWYQGKAELALSVEKPAAVRRLLQQRGWAHQQERNGRILDRTGRDAAHQQAGQTGPTVGRHGNQTHPGLRRDAIDDRRRLTFANLAGQRHPAA
ncbi:MAG TPA: hypothetical protein VF937_09880 [Chloroflexota bacterium]